MTTASATELNRWLTMRGSSIELRQLRIFVSVVDQGSFRRAAERLGMRPSSVSRRVRDLEQSLGTQLFSRHPGGVLVTEAGQRFCPFVRSLMGQLAEVAGTVADEGITRREVSTPGRTCAGSLSVSIAAITCVTCKTFDSEHALTRFRMQR